MHRLRSGCVSHGPVVGHWGGALTLRRHLRVRQATPSAELAVHETTAPELRSSMQRPSPCAMELSYLVERLPDKDVLDEDRTEPSVWTAATVRAAWRAYYTAFCRCATEDPMRAAELQRKDLHALARVTALAEIRHLLALLPPTMREAVTAHPHFSFDDVEELFMHVGQDVEVRCGVAEGLVQLPPPSLEDLRYVLQRVGKFGEDGRGCIPHTGHRASLWRGRQGEPLGVTLRVGRYVPGAATALGDLTARGSLLIISKAGMGKTTLLRDLAATIANQPHQPRVTIVDTSNEIGGDDPVPLPFLGRCRRIQVPSRDQQSRVMTEVIQNHTPEYLLVDELATAEEAQAAWSISQRGVRLIATCHGENMAGLLQNQALNLLVGGAAQAFLSNEERRLRNKTKKTVLERPYASPFVSVVELRSRKRGFVYVDVNKAVDLILDDKNATLDASVGGEVTLADRLPARLLKLAAAADQTQGTPQSAGAERETHSGRAATSGGVPCTRDEDGYTVPSQSSGGGSRSRSRKTNDELYKELSDFL